jgi:hypothetical protein
MATRNRESGRGSLPIPDRPKIGLTTFDAKDPESKYPPIEPLRPPEGAPNVLVVLIDDVGFGASSAFGGPCIVGLCMNPPDHAIVLCVDEKSAGVESDEADSSPAAGRAGTAIP